MASGRCYLQSHGNFFKVSPSADRRHPPPKYEKKKKGKFEFSFLRQTSRGRLIVKNGKAQANQTREKRNPKIKNRAIAMAVCTEKARCLAVWLLLLLLFFFDFSICITCRFCCWCGPANRLGLIVDFSLLFSPSP
jgi:hypothetical protein